MQTAIKGFKRVTDKITWNGSYGSYDIDYPSSNLSIEPLAYVCRSQDTTLQSTRYLGVLDRSRIIKIFGIARHNISLNGKFRLRVYGTFDKNVTSNGTTASFTSTNHGFTNGMSITFWSETNTLPSDVFFGNIYYVHVLTANTFTIHLIQEDSQDGVNPVGVSTVSSGLHCLADIVYDSGWEDVWPVVYGDTPEWEDDNWWSGKYLSEEIIGYKPTRPIILPSLTLACSFSIEIDDTSNESGYVDIGLVEVSRGWQFSVNPSVGAKFGFRFRTIETESDSGVKEFERRDKPRTFSGVIEYTEKDEALETAFEDQRQLDIDTIFIWILSPDNPRYWLRETYIARNTINDDISYSGPNNFNIPINIEEVL